MLYSVYMFRDIIPMKKILITLLFVICTMLVYVSFVWEASADNRLFSQANNLSIGSVDGSESSSARKNDKLKDFDENDQFISVSKWWWEWLYNTLIRLARDIKNLFYMIASVYFLIITLKLIFSNNSEEELGNFKKGIIWISVWLIIMQVAYAFVTVWYDKGVSAYTAVGFMDYIVMPLIALLQTLVSLFFIAIAVFAFYTLVTANGNEEAIKNSKNSIVYALIGFLIVRFAQEVVEAFYGKINCEDYGNGFIVVDGGKCVNQADVSEWINIVIMLINWFNGFVALVVLLMIMYAGSQILLSGGDEEKIKKWKQSIIYIAVWLVILALNYLILTFFLRPEGVI